MVLNHLEINYNAVLRLATGLPHWTPIPILIREGGGFLPSRRLHLPIKFFLIRLLSLPDAFRLREDLLRCFSTFNPQRKW